MKIFLRSFLIVCIISVINSNFIHAQSFDWVKGISSSVGSVAGGSVTVDVAGNSYVTGNFYGTTTFGSLQLTSFGNSDIFVAKYDPAGTCLWVKQAGSSDADAGYSISLDLNGNIYVTGYFSGTAAFGSIQLTSVAGYDVFIAKYDAAGNCIWAKSAGSIYNDWGYTIAVDASGNSYLTGRFNGSITFGTINLTGFGSWYIFIAKYDTKGNCIWAQVAGGAGTDEGYGLALDAKGRSYITGRFSGNATFGTFLLSSYGGYDIFTAKYDTNGICLWAKKAGSINADRGMNISVDANENSYVTGWFKGTVTFDTIQLPGIGNNDIFVAKYDTYGNCIWAKQMGGINDDAGNAISVDQFGNSFTTGLFQGPGTFGTYQLSGFKNQDVFITHYDSKGNCIWAQQAGGLVNDYGNGITTDASGNCFVTGVFQDSATFGTIKLYGGGAFISKMINAPVPVEFGSFTYDNLSNGVKLKWITVTETNNSHFEIERRKYNSDWTKIGEKSGAGNSTSPRDYSFSDLVLRGNGIYYYRLRQVDYNGKSKYSKEIQVRYNLIPDKYALENNYPNPFNPSTLIRYSLPSESSVKLKVYNSMGQIVKELVSELQSEGIHEVNFDASALSSGIYYYSFEANSADGNQSYRSAKKMVFMK
jgi:hypothetical protein